MNEKIGHSGVIESVEDGCLRVRILQESACAACKVAGQCHAAESKEKIVDVYIQATDGYTVGQTVTVTASKNAVKLSMAVAFGLPLVIMVLALVLTLLITGSEAKAGLAALLVLVPYYLMVWMMRNRIGAVVTFRIEA